MLTANAIANRNLHSANAVACYLPMEPIPTRKRRLENLRAEVLRAGGPKPFVKKYCLERDPSYLSQVLNGHRSLGEQAARNLENDCGWEPGYLDREEPANDNVFELIKRLPPDLRASLEDHVRKLFKSLQDVSPK